MFGGAGVGVGDVEGERAVGGVLVGVERGGVEEVALERVGYEELGLAVVHGERPEGLGGRQGAFGEVELVAGF